MLYYFLFPLHEYISSFNVFRYITFRTIYATLTAFFICFILGPWIIKKLRQLQVGQYIRDCGPESHKAKGGTPTMGGLMIIGAVLISGILWCDITNPFIWITLFTMVLFGAIGFADDYIKVVKKNNLGLRSWQKMSLQIICAVIVGLLLLASGLSTVVTIPFVKDSSPDLGWFYIIFALIVIVGASNAVNLTDGLDGLATGPYIVAVVTYMIFGYVAGHIEIAEYLNINYIAGSGEIAVICGALAGAGAGFLWYNSYPAQIFMGDVGSLSLGATLGVIAIIAKQEIILILVGGIFVMETVSVILQVGCFKMTKGHKRLFRMAPIHHHFELKGWAEPKVIVRFWIIAIGLALLALSTLKIR